MKNLTKKQRNEVYRLALDLQKSDRIDSTRLGHPQSGLCRILAEALYRLKYSLSWMDCLSAVENLPEFKKLKPKYKGKADFWWGNNPSSRVREVKLKQIINETS